MRAKDVLGRQGEELAARYLTQLGMTVVDRNWRCRQGELDIVARDGEALVFCEVKTRSSTRYGSPLEALTDDKLARLRQLAALWLRAHEVNASAIRIDVLGIVCPRGGRPEYRYVRAVG